MKHKSLILVLLTSLLAVIFIYYNFENKETDAIRFKKSYESLNGTYTSSNEKYNEVKISENNPIEYIDASYAAKIIKEKTGIIYFGANWCPWCRNAIEVLFEAADRENIDTIYYVDMDQVRNTWEVKNGKLVKKQVEGEGYYDLLAALDSVLGTETYKITKENQVYDTNEKRIYLPTVVAFKNGQIKDIHVGTVTLDEGKSKYDKLTKDEHDKLLKIYEELIEKTKESDVCERDSSC